jgi:hypothetical protein
MSPCACCPENLVSGSGAASDSPLKSCVAKPISDLNVLLYEEEEAEILLNDEVVELTVTMDSGSIVNVVHPEDLPAGCTVEKRSTRRTSWAPMEEPSRIMASPIP